MQRDAFRKDSTSFPRCGIRAVSTKPRGFVDTARAARNN